MVALSFLVLYLELALIRWVTGYVHNFGYFTNFAMLAAFLGIGVGCLLGRRMSAIALLPSILVALALIVRVAQLQIDLPSKSPTAVFWSEAMAAETKAPVAAAVLVLFVLISAVFLGLGQILGELFAELPRLRAYGFNVLGGLAGILLFAIDSHFDHPPLVWFTIAVVVALPFLFRATTRRALWPVNGAILVAFLYLVGMGTSNETWSPYYRQTLLKGPGGFLLAGNGIPGITLAGFEHLANAGMYEAPFSEALRALRKDPEAPFRNELVIGCGGGNDVAMSLQHGVLHVDAVDINPWVIAMGKRHHPLHPFDSDRVTTYVADGREFLARPGEKYDLIVYGLPDSTFTNDRSNLRVESFIFTTEAFQSALSRLSDDGVFVIYNYYRVGWLVEKIHGMLRAASSQEPYTRVFTGPTGAPLPFLPAAMAVGPGLRLPPAGTDASPPPATDDWPFLYLTEPNIPANPYLISLAIVAIVSISMVVGALVLTRKDRGEETATSEKGLVLATLFFMGIAFVLLETRSVVTFGLFFGSTWWNNVVVFASIHVSILLAVVVNARWPSVPRGAMVAALLASLAFAWWLPPEMLLVGSTTTRAVLAGSVAFLPIFCANVFFASIFRSTSEGRISYAFNLLGGILGGLFEYVALLVGYRALIGFATLFYLVALLCAVRTKSGESAPLATD
ncbi:MAG: hypothetical protein ACLQVI_43190 [Polyangiaceae bacterium]